MSRLAAATVLFAAGLAIGLWLGFNPQGRAAVEKNWERASESVARIQTNFSVKLDGGQTAPEARKPADSTRTPGESPLAPLARVLEDLWNATQTLWLSLLARLGVSH